MDGYKDLTEFQVLHCCRWELNRFAHLGGFLQMPCIVLLYIMPGTDGSFQLISHHHAWALCGGPSNKQHHTSPCVWECALREKRRGIWL